MGFEDLKEFFKNSTKYATRVGDGAPIANEDEVGGMSRKFFGLVPDGARHTVMGGKFFDELWHDLKKGNSNYRTIYNDMIYGEPTFTPSYVSAMVKYDNDNFNMPLNEYVGAKVCALLQSPTVFNTCFRADNKNGYNVVSMSVDCVRPGEIFLNLWQIMGEYALFMDGDESTAGKDSLNIQKFMSYFDHNFESDLQKQSYIFDDKGVLLEEPKFNPSPSDIDKFKKDFLYQYLVRFAILGDTDYGANNIGVILNKDGKMELSPNFDTEGAVTSFYNGQNNDRLQRILAVIYETDPEIVERLYKNCKKMEGKIDEVVDSADALGLRPDDEKGSKKYDIKLDSMKTILRNNIGLFSNITEQLNPFIEYEI